jgi:hypothetical protein
VFFFFLPFFFNFTLHHHNLFFIVFFINFILQYYVVLSILNNYYFFSVGLYTNLMDLCFFIIISTLDLLKMRFCSFLNTFYEFIPIHDPRRKFNRLTWVDPSFFFLLPFVIDFILFHPTIFS